MTYHEQLLPTPPGSKYSFRILTNDEGDAHIAQILWDTEIAINSRRQHDLNEAKKHAICLVNSLNVYYSKTNLRYEILCRVDSNLQQLRKKYTTTTR